MPNEIQARRRARGLLFAATAFSLWAAPVLAEDKLTSDAFSAEQQAAIEAMIRDYILKNPETVIETLTAYQIQQKEAQQIAAREAVGTAQAELNNDPASPVIGNPDGDVTVVEFFDYRCGYCKRVLPDVQALLAGDGNIRYVLKEYPILGPGSLTAAKASLAVWQTQPDKYMDVHAALLSAPGTLDEQRVLDIIEKQGADRRAIADAMAKPEIEQALRENFELGQRLGVNGTPAFIIGDELVPGAIGLDQMKELVADARSG